MPKRLVNPIDELERLQHRSTTMFVDHLLAIVRSGAANRDAAKEIIDLTDLIASSTGIADMLGRRRLLIEIDHHLGKRLQFADVETPLIPNVTFTEALEDMVAREPRLARSAQEVRDLYNTPTGKFFSMAKVRANRAGMEILERVQEIIAKAIREGRETDTTIRAIERQAENFTRAYAQTVFRTNLTTAYTEGRFAQARDPDVADFVPAFRYDAVGDADTRPNHAAGEGFIAGVDDPIWNRYRPPNGYNCRCMIELVAVDDLRRLGAIRPGGGVYRGQVRGGKFRRLRDLPRGAFPDAGFR